MGPIRVRRATHQEILKNMSQFEGEIKSIKKCWETYTRAGDEALHAIIGMGEKLTVVRDWIFDKNNALPKDHGIAWEKWCKKNLPFGKRQADRYRSIFRNKSKIKFSEKESVSVRAAVTMITEQSGDGTTSFQCVVKGKSDIKPKIEAASTGKVSAAAAGHQLRLTWRDDEVGKMLYKNALDAKNAKKAKKPPNTKAAIAPDEVDMLATACAQLFGFALNKRHGGLGKRICDVIRQLPSGPQNAEALEALVQRMEFAMVGAPNTAGNGAQRGTGSTGADGDTNTNATNRENGSTGQTGADRVPSERQLATADA